MNNTASAYPCNLISRVLGKSISESELPNDIDISIRYAYTLLSESYAERVLVLLFREGLTQKEIADKMQCTTSRIGVIFRTSMKELSLGNRPMLFSHGYSYCCENRVLGPWLITKSNGIPPEILFDLSVYDLLLDMRSTNNLHRGNIYTVGELVQKTEDDLLKIRGMGSKGVIAIKNRLAEMGLSLMQMAKESKNTN